MKPNASACRPRPMLGPPPRRWPRPPVKRRRRVAMRPMPPDRRTRRATTKPVSFVQFFALLPLLLPLLRADKSAFAAAGASLYIYFMYTTIGIDLSLYKRFTLTNPPPVNHYPTQHTHSLAVAAVAAAAPPKLYLYIHPNH